MIKSMTGYGRATAAAGTKLITVEVRTLNSKQLDLGVKMPGVYRSVEHEVRSLAAARVGRGKADVYVNVEESDSAGAARINEALFADYYRQISEASKKAKLPLAGSGFDSAALVASILRLPDVMVSTETAELPDAERAALLEATGGAMDALDTFRAGEGAILLDDVMGRVATIGELLGQVEPFETARVPAVKARILENITAVGVTVDANRLEQEIVFWVEKLDITEEKVRLAKHLDYFRETSAEEGAGRKLGFIAQEMGREINTLGSKANDADIQKLVVRMKDELEKIKEQLLNIL